VTTSQLKLGYYSIFSEIIVSRNIFMKAWRLLKKK